jgi:DNA-binding transcriptional LysR family regulator
MNKHLKIKYSANDMMAYKALVLNGLGVGLLPELLIKEELKQKKLKVFYPDIKLTFPVLLDHHGSYPLTLEAQRMIEVLKEKIW